MKICLVGISVGLKSNFSLMVIPAKARIQVLF